MAFHFNQVQQQRKKNYKLYVQGTDSYRYNLTNTNNTDLGSLDGVEIGDSNDSTEDDTEHDTS